MKTMNLCACLKKKRYVAALAAAMAVAANFLCETAIVGGAFFAATSMSGCDKDTAKVDDDNKMAANAANALLACLAQEGADKSKCISNVDTSKLPNLSWLFRGSTTTPPSDFDAAKFTKYEKVFYESLKNSEQALANAGIELPDISDIISGYDDQSRCCADQVVQRLLPADATGCSGTPAYDLRINFPASLADDQYLFPCSECNLDLARNLLYHSDIERYIVLEINRCRANPLAWVKEVSLYGGEVQLWVDALGADYTLPPLAPAKGLWLAARWWSSEQSRIGNMTHANMDSRMNTYGTWGGSIGENVGPASIQGQASGPGWKTPDEGRNARVLAARIVNEFIRDRGNSDKGHRKNIMSGSFKYVGIAYNKNGNGEYYVTMEFAQNYTDKPAAAQTDVWQCQ